MEALIEEIVRKLHHLPEVKILEVLDFVEFLTWNKERSISQQVESDFTSQEAQEFEAIANQAMKVNNISQILTLNVADFRRYTSEDIVAIAPEQVGRETS